MEESAHHLNGIWNELEITRNNVFDKMSEQLN